MADDFVDEQALARDMIEVHGMEAATVARDNARGAALALQAAQGRPSPGSGCSGSSSGRWLAKHHRPGRLPTVPRRVNCSYEGLRNFTR